MAEPKEAHVVEIPVDSDSKEEPSISIGIHHHPLTEISESPGHLLLLKLWQREEDLTAGLIGGKESRLDAIKHEAFALSSLFFAFHAIFFVLLFNASVSQDHQKACKNWWVPSCLSLLTSFAVVSCVQMRICEYWRVSSELQRERGDARALSRCVQELRMKGASFDLSREPQVLKRVKSSSVEVRWQPLRWCSRYLVTVCLVCFAGLVFLASRFIVCG